MEKETQNQEEDLQSVEINTTEVFDSIFNGFINPMFK